MPQDDSIRVEGVVLELLPSRALRLELPNGCRVLGFCAGRCGPEMDRIGRGDRVKLEMTPFDMSKARVVGVLS